MMFRHQPDKGQSIMHAKQLLPTLPALLLCSAALAATGEAEQADTFFQAGDWEQSAAAYRDLTRKDEDNAQYWSRLGSSYHRLERYNDAMAAFETSLEIAGEEAPPATLLFLARSQAAAGQQDAAIGTLTTLAETGARPYLAVKGSEEFASMKNNGDYRGILEAMKPCQDEQYRAFDFWLGQWDVTTPTRAGWQASSSITVSNDGCSIDENYTSPSGMHGKSINFYDAGRDVWHQTWIDNQGSPLYLEGKLEDGAMVLADERNRITWTQLPDGRVRQLWEMSSDGGETWTTAFDGYYQRKK
jgi:tetratricopeptide (TPR) repeat protein